MRNIELENGTTNMDMDNGTTNIGMENGTTNIQVKNSTTNMEHKKEPSINIETDRVHVKQRIGLLGGIAFVMGSVIGSGIFISPKGALVNAGSIGLSLLVWALSGVISLIMGLVYGELGTLVPKSGGDYIYIMLAFGEAPAFLITWVATIVSQPGSRAVLSLVFADYLCAPIFGKCGPSNFIRKSIAVIELLTLAVTNILSVRFAAFMQVFFTIAKVLALIVISVGGFVYLFQGRVENFDNSFQDSNWNVESISLAIYSCIWAYGGYNNLNEIAEEIINPRKNIPRAIIISMIAITAIYLTTNVSYAAILPKDEFVSASAVAFLWGEKVLKYAALIIPISVMCSVHGASNGGFFTDSRVRFAAARAGHLPEVLSYLHPQSRIPIVSVVFNTVCAIIMLIPGDVGELINMVGFVGFIVQGASTVSLLILRYRRRNKERKKDEFRLPIIVPVLALLICIFMIISPFVNSPKIEFVYGAAFVLGGLIFYFPFVYFQLSIPGFDYVTVFVQLLMNVCPTALVDYED